jgi:hypothetical protein
MRKTYLERSAYPETYPNPNQAPQRPGFKAFGRKSTNIVNLPSLTRFRLYVYNRRDEEEPLFNRKRITISKKFQHLLSSLLFSKRKSSRFEDHTYLCPFILAGEEYGKTSSPLTGQKCPQHIGLNHDKLRKL